MRIVFGVFQIGLEIIVEILDCMLAIMQVIDACVSIVYIVSTL